MCLVAICFSAMSSASAEPARLTPEHFFRVCEAANVDAAAPLGDQLGWTRTPEADMEEWKQSFENYLQMQPAAIGWRNREGEPPETLNYWTGTGDNSFHACSYWGPGMPEIAEVLVARYGALPDATPESSYWALGKTQVSYSKSGANIYVTIGIYD